MGRYTGKTARLSYMLILTSTYFLVEIIVGYVTNSMALVADSFHMLSDVLALVIGLFSVRISKKSTSKNTFGWARAEVLGALVNAVFLLALCFSILVESMKRIIMPEGIERPVLLIVVGSIGLLINLVGLLVLGSHGHSHGGHGHSHGGHGHSHGGHGHGHGHGQEDSHDHDTGHGHSHGSSAVSPEGTANTELQVITPKSYDLTANHHLNTVEEISPNTRASLSDVHLKRVTPDADADEKKKKPKTSAQMNMRGVFLHVLGDALGSVVVIISAIIMWQIPCEELPCPDTQPNCEPETTRCWTLYVDPGMSIFLVAIILSSTIPLLKESALILLQTVPTHIEVEKIKKRLLEKIAGVMAVHEFHVWQLAGNRIIASAHIHCQNLNEYRRIAEDVKEFFHNEGIHSTTIQPEFVERPAEFSAETKNRDCILECKPEECRPSMCCGNKLQPKGNDNQIRHRGHSHVDNSVEVPESTLEEGQRSTEPDVVEITSCACQH